MVQVASLVMDTTEETFKSVVELSGSVPVVIDLWAEWCGPCKQLSPVIEKIIHEYAGKLVLAKVDVDANPGLQQAFRATSIPAVVALVAGRPVPLFVGAQPEAQIRQVFDQLLELAATQGVTGVAVADDSANTADVVEEEEIPELILKAGDALAEGKYDEAIDLYKQHLAEDPGNPEVTAAIVQVELLKRVSAQPAAEVRKQAADNPKDIEAALAVSDLDIAGGHVTDAFDRLLDLFATEVDSREQIRERLLDHFVAVGAEDERVIAARRKLANLLF
ncbi:MAG: tetratricopeptide repeat protein [Microbacteriaceae bacterium]|nr:tetratricopeptide repeat protein [Microbacteriaceae bacterium]